MSVRMVSLSMGQNTQVLDGREWPWRIRRLRLLRDHGTASLETHLVMCDGHIEGAEK